MRHENSEAEDERVVRRVLSGDRRAFETLLGRHRASVLRLCRRVLGSEAAAEDVTQEAALQAFLGLARLREPRYFSAWLHSIATNLAYGTLRRRGPGSLDPLIGDASLVDVSPGPEEVQAARELHDAVLAALGELSEVNREAVVGYYLEGQSYAELAELLDVPVSTVKGRLHKGRRQLGPALAPVAREMFGSRRKERSVEVQDRIEVVVDEVIRLASPGEGMKEFPEIARLMTVPEDPAAKQAPAPSAAFIMREADGGRVLPIYVGLNEAFSIWLTISGSRSMRPMTHDLMGQIMDTVQLHLESATVSRLAKDVFYAEVSINQEEKTYTMDARPSDAIALAVRRGASIYAARAMFDEQALPSKQAWPNWHREQFDD